MNEIKIQNIEIKGIRGIRNTLSIPLEGQSVVIYGDNGSGKSSISDSIEWFFKDEVRHLSSMEVDLKEALRNTSLPEEENSLIKVDLSNKTLNSEKYLSFKKGKLISLKDNDSTEFNNYLINTSKENLLLRFQHLTEFVDKTKGEKLKSLSDVIGYSEVNKVKDVLRKVYGSVKSEIKNQNFENQINTQKEILKDKIGAVVSVEQNLLERIAEIIKPLNLNIDLKSIIDLDLVLQRIKSPLDNPLLTEFKFLENIKNTLSTLSNEINLISSEYTKYFNEFNVLANDIQSIMETFLAEMLKAGESVLEKRYHKDESCPLCLQALNTDNLLIDIKNRLKEIEESSKKKASFDNAKQSIIKICNERVKRLDLLKSESLLKDDSNKEIKIGVDFLIEKFNNYIDSSNKKVTSGIKIKNPEELQFSNDDFSILNNISLRIGNLKQTIEKDNTTTIYSNISATKDAFIRIKRFEYEKLKLEKQKDSLEIIYNEFVKKQKQALDNFITVFSGKINEYYQFMNPGEQFDEIKIVTMGEEDELVGIRIEYKYNNNWVWPPQKYFSESHLNCFGISFYLASLEAFNKENKFFILDDVISSFDANHRKRFADLLLEKFSDYQIILLTHEINWFEYIRNAVKNRPWLIKVIKWTETLGAHLDEPPIDFKSKIDSKISSSNLDKLGNDIREYLENILKQVALNIEVRVKYLPNEKNEDRMAYELLTEIKSRISKSSAFTKHMALFERALNSIFIGNKDSHDSTFVPSIGDLKAFWTDVQEIESLFFCETCKKPVHFKYYDESLKVIKCKCGFKTYDLKK